MSNTTPRLPTRQQRPERSQQPPQPAPATRRDQTAETERGSPFVKKTVLERLENEGGPTETDAPGTDPTPSLERRGYDIVT